MTITPGPFRPMRPLSNVVPFTVSDGMTYLRVLNALRDYIVTDLVPNLSEVVEKVYDDYVSSSEFNQQRIVESVEEFNRLHDDFMANVNERFDALAETAAVKAVDNYLSNPATVDAAVARKIFEPYSAISTALDSEYAVRHSVDTRIMDGDSALDRLNAAISEGGNIHLAENVIHTGNIPNFWERKINGAGTIDVGDGVVFTPDPRPLSHHPIVNNIYVDAQRGNNSNDGLTWDTALQTLHGVYWRVLARLDSQQAAGARWVINLRGEFTDGVRATRLKNFPLGLVFQGQSYPTGGTPRTSIKKISSSLTFKGIWIEYGIQRVEVYDILFDGWAHNTYGAGVYMNHGGEITVKRCVFRNSDNGVTATQNVNFWFNENVIESNVRVGMAAKYNSTGQFNYNKVNGGADSRYGIEVSRNSVVHVDYCDIRDWGEAGIHVDMASRAGVVGNTFTNNEHGILVSGSAEWNNVDNTFINNRHAFLHRAGGKEFRMHSNTAGGGQYYRVSHTATNSIYGIRQVNNVTSSLILYRGNTAGTIPAQWFTTGLKNIKIIITGRVNTAGGYVQIGSAEYGSSTDFKPFALAQINAAGAFRIESVVTAAGSASQRTITQITDSTKNIVQEEVSTADMNADRQIMVRLTSGTAPAVEFTTYGMEVFYLG